MFSKLTCMRVVQFLSGPVCELMVYGHFGPKTLRTQDISALCLVPKCLTIVNCQEMIRFNKTAFAITTY